MLFSVVLSAVLIRRIKKLRRHLRSSHLAANKLVSYFVEVALTSPTALVIIHFRSIIRFCVKPELHNVFFFDIIQVQKGGLFIVFD